METSEYICMAAEEGFSEKGYIGAKLSDIAKRAGLTTGTVYAPFKIFLRYLQKSITKIFFHPAVQAKDTERGYMRPSHIENVVNLSPKQCDA